MYLEIFDGLRAFYARKEGEHLSPAFSAAMALSIMLEINVVSLITICEFALFRSFTSIEWIVNHKALMVLAGITIGWLHVAVGKHTGIYHRKGPTQSPRWVRLWVVYTVLTLTGFVASLLLAFLAREGLIYSH